MCRHAFAQMVLVNAMGMLPQRGEILDQFLVNTIEYIRSGFYNQDKYVELYTAEPPIDQLEQWEINREMTSRIAYKPYMYDQTLPNLIRCTRTPTLIVWGKENQIVPFECGELYRDAIVGARLATIAGAGHFAEVEKPAELAKLVRDFAGGR
jgi:pimeloyl-ACP methyl ester carboxylesterase